MTTVWLRSSVSTADVYHTDPDCQNCPQSSTDKQLEELPDGLRECDVCAGRSEPQGSPDTSFYEAAMSFDGENDAGVAAGDQERER